MGPHSGSELLPESSPSTPAAQLEGFFKDADGYWMQFPGGWWKLLGSDPEVEEFGKLDFSGDVSFRQCNAWFDSGYMLCVWWLLTYFTHFLRCGGLESLSFLSPFGLNGEVCPVDASGCCLALRGSHLETLDALLRVSRG